MKIFLFLLIAISTALGSYSQVLKRLGNEIKNEAEYKLRNKARQKVSQGIDSILTPSQKAEKAKEKTTTQQPGSATPNATAGSSGSEGGDGMGMGEGFIQLSVSAHEVFKGGVVVVTGSSIKYEGLREVKMIVTGNGKTENETLPLYENGSYAAGWQANEAGEFTITVMSSDGKDKKSEKVTVVDMELLDDWTEDNLKETNRALDKLKKEAQKVKESVGQKDRQELERRLKEVEQKTAAAVKLFQSLDEAARQLARLTKKGEPLPPNLTGNLSQLNDQLSAQYNEMKKINDAVDHEPYDNTICEYIVMVNEALAAFSTFTNLWTKSATGLIKNIVLDKAAPKAVEVVNDNTIKMEAPKDFMAKEASKIFLTSQFDAENLVSKLGVAGIAGDVGQYLTEVLLKTYCGIFKGDLSHKYTIIYRNSAKVIWWQYSYTTKAAVTFRYPKNTNGGLIKMKGNIEGNATSFRFTEDVEQEDEFREKMKSRARLIHIPLIRPVSMSTSSTDADVLGFGAVARGVGTPAYFNIPVDANYNTDGGTIELFLNNAIIDFSPLVKYTYGFLAIAVGIPLVTRVDFPINKARATLNAVVSRNNQLQVTKSANNKLIAKGQGERHIGSETAEIEHKINYNLTATNQ